MSYEQILYEVQGPMALITINRAERHNAISLATLDELQTAVAVAAHEDRWRQTGGFRTRKVSSFEARAV